MMGLRVPATSYPDGKTFAFTILDDTDDATVDNVGPMYELLHELRMYTTKTVWPLPCPEGSTHYFAGATLASREYLAFCRLLAARGFEVTWHCATMESSVRSRTLEGLEAFRRAFGSYPSLHCNHGQNQENIYWGPKRYRSRILRWLQRRVGAGRDPVFEGELEASPFFWGDLCLEHFPYVRGFTFESLDCRAILPSLCYRLRSTPYVRSWFITSDAADATAFKRVVTRRAIERLRQQGGACILSTHLGKGFVRGGVVDAQIEDTLRHLASLPGWFVPTTQILRQAAVHGVPHPLSTLALWKLEWRHALDRVRNRQ